MKEEDPKVLHIISACRKGDFDAQNKLYEHFYGYAMGIALRYCNNREDAMEIINDGFLNIFLQLKRGKKIRAFKPWLRKIIINTAIDAFRKKKGKVQTLDVAYAAYETDSYSIIDELAEEEIIKLIQKLSPAYRMIFNLYVIEGYRHKEIAQKLKIEISTSKANLTKAKARLRQLISKFDLDKVERYG